MLNLWIRSGLCLSLVGFQFLLGCGKATNKNSVLSPQVGSGCSFPVQVSLTIASPTSGIIGVNQPVTFKVRMQGCLGSYVISGPAGIPILNQSATADSSNNYTAELSYTKSFSAVGMQQESVIVTPRSASGALLPNDARNGSLDISVGGSNPIAPTCEIRKTAPVSGNGQPAQFALFVLSGSSASSTMNGNSVVPGVSYPLGPSISDGKYYVYGSVTGSGGTGLCQLVVTPPSCALGAVSVTNGSVSLRLTVSGPVSNARLGSLPILLPVPPSNSVNFNYATSGSGSQTLTVQVLGSENDAGSCSVSFNRCRAEYTVESGFPAKSSPFKDLGPGASNFDTFLVVNGIWAGAGGIAPTNVLLNLRGGDRITFEQISGVFYWFGGFGYTCNSGQDFSGPSLVPVLQFTDAAGKVVTAPIATASNRNAMALGDLIGRSIIVPAGAIGLYGSVADNVSSDNNGSCELRMRVTPSCQ